MHVVDLSTVIRMLEISCENVLPINTHRLTEGSGSLEDLVVGFGDVTFHRLREHIDTTSLHIMLNINHRTTASKALSITRRAYELTGIRLVKLEVLTEDLRESNDLALIEVAERLKVEMPDLVVVPLLSSNPSVARDLVDVGCPMLRVMGSSIGMGGGVRDAQAFKACCAVDVPVILDGGVGGVEDFRQALALGAEGCLVNSMLFEDPRGPIESLTEFMHAATSILLEDSAVRRTNIRARESL